MSLLADSSFSTGGGTSFWPFAVFLCVVVVCIAAVAIVGIIKGGKK